MASDRLEMIYGIRPVMEAIRSGKQLEKVLVQKGLKGTLIDELLYTLRKNKMPLQFVPGEKLNRLTLKNHQGVVAYVSRIIYQDIETILPGIFERGKAPLILVLDRITDVRNFGAIARTAECVGVDALVIPSRGSAMINADAVKTSAGALNHIPVHRSRSLKETVRFLHDSGLMIIGLSEKASANYTDPDYSSPLAVVMGSEEDGISPAVMKRCDHLVHLPMKGKTGSLNVSVATGVILYEVLNQRLASENQARYTNK